MIVYLRMQLEVAGVVRGGGDGGHFERAPSVGGIAVSGFVRNPLPDVAHHVDRYLMGATDLPPVPGGIIV